MDLQAMLPSLCTGGPLYTAEAALCCSSMQAAHGLAAYDAFGSSAIDCCSYPWRDAEGRLCCLELNPSYF